MSEAKNTDSEPMNASMPMPTKLKRCEEASGSSGSTQAPPNQAYSSPLIISSVPQGQRIVKFVKPGCADVQVVASIQDGQTTTISNVQLKRLFIPDTIIVVKDGRTLRGLINRVENDGTVHFETAPGIFVDVAPDDISSKKPLAPAGK